MLLLLFLSNCLNYLDRQLFLSLLPVMKNLYQLSDPVIGLLSSVFTLAYLLAAPLSGFLGTKFRMDRLIGWGILLFTIGMMLSALAHVRWILFSGRILTGFGEAVLSTLGPVLLFEIASRGKGSKLGWFYLAIPLGSAIGFFLSGSLLLKMSVHQILFLPVIPGLLCALIFLLRKETTSQSFLSDSFHSTIFHSWKHFFSGLTKTDRNLVFLSFQLQTLVTFVLGGMAAWMTFYFIRVKMFPIGTIEALTGAMLLGGGVIGMLGGGFFLDRELLSRHHHAYRRPTFTGLFLALLGVLIVLLSHSLIGCGVGLLISISGIFFVYVPLNWILLTRRGKVSPAVLIGASLLVSHLLGDLLSPTIIGEVSAYWGIEIAVEMTLVPPLLFAIGLYLYSTRVSSDV